MSKTAEAPKGDPDDYKRACTECSAKVSEPCTLLPLGQVHFTRRLYRKLLPVK